jgi:HYR domain-containing protein
MQPRPIAGRGRRPSRVSRLSGLPLPGILTALGLTLALASRSQADVYISYNPIVPGPAFTHCPPTGTTAIATCTPAGIGALVSFSPLAATDNCGSPTVTYDHQPGSFFAPGNTTVTATATDTAANTATCPFTVSVAYAWSGVLPPINADGSSVFKLGSTVPVVFQLTGPSACVTTLQATLSYTKVSSNVSSTVNKAGSTSGATSGNLFRYSSGQYLVNWGTKGLSSGTYQLQINLGDGVTRTVNVGLK